MNVYTQPSDENCPDCTELVDANCVVYEQSFTSTGLGAGKTLSQILKSINAKLLKFSSWFKKLIYNFTPVFESGIPIATYTDGSCTTPTVNLNIPLFLNGKYCFEFPIDEETTGYFSVLSVMGSYVFYDDEGLEVTDPLIIATYEELFTEGLVVPTCCTDCGGSTSLLTTYRSILSQEIIDLSPPDLLVIGEEYVIHTLEAGDDFSNVGYVSEGTPFIATATTPTVWTNGTIVIDIAASSPSVGAILVDNISITPVFTFSYITDDKISYVMTFPTLTLDITKTDLNIAQSHPERHISSIVSGGGVEIVVKNLTTQPLLGDLIPGSTIHLEIYP